MAVIGGIILVIIGATALWVASMGKFGKIGKVFVDKFEKTFDEKESDK